MENRRKNRLEGASKRAPWKIELCTVTSENWQKEKESEKVWENGWAAQKVNGFKGGTGGRGTWGGFRGGCFY